MAQITRILVLACIAFQMFFPAVLKLNTPTKISRPKVLPRPYFPDLHSFSFARQETRTLTNLQLALLTKSQKFQWRKFHFLFYVI